jgi:hypothetical protein
LLRRICTIMAVVVVLPCHCDQPPLCQQSGQQLVTFDDRQPQCFGGTTFRVGSVDGAADQDEVRALIGGERRQCLGTLADRDLHTLAGQLFGGRAGLAVAAADLHPQFAQDTRDGAQPGSAYPDQVQAQRGVLLCNSCLPAGGTLTHFSSLT